jgi:tetratricopeptide (TPR) repeat protein
MSARAFIILAMVVVVPKVQAATSLRGVVLSNEIGGPPMGNVEVSAVGGNLNNTGADGQFTFKFPNKNPGDTVLLSVRKEGYVVVNDIQREQTLPANPDDRLVTLLLCKEGDREEMARRFYRLKGDEAIDATYRKKFEEAQNASGAEIAKLRQERDQAKEAAEKAAEGLAKQKPGGGSELYRTAMRLFLDGKVDEALVTLNDEKLRELSKAAKEKKTEAEKTTEEAIQAWLLKAQLFTVQFRFDDAEKAYQGAIDTSPDSFQANFAFAGFNQDLNRYDEAMRAYSRCLELARLKGVTAISLTR